MKALPTLPPDDRELLDRFLEGDLSEEEFSAFQDRIRDSPLLRDHYLAAVRMDTLLRKAASHVDSPAPSLSPTKVPRKTIPLAVLGPALGFTILLFAALITWGLLPPPIAELTSAEKTRWLSEEPSSSLYRGQELHLAAGQLELQFRSGAVTRLFGPAHLTLVSPNSAFLHYGQAYTVAEDPRAHGFTIRTHSGDFVDQGTAFLTTAQLDGFSQMHVSSGAVDAVIDGFGT
ncbi:MAG: hypothetical protein AAGJ31_07435, partial [Verrucomicrobiota bacterium]